MEPRVHTGVPEALDAEHRLLGRAEHGERLVVEFTLKYSNIYIDICDIMTKPTLL